MTRRDTLRDEPKDAPDTEERERHDTLDKLDGPLPKYVFERSQSDQADAARYHADAKAPPAPAGVKVQTGRIEIAPTPVPPKKDTDPGLGPVGEEEVERAIRRARSGPMEDIEPEEYAHLNALRMRQDRPVLEGVETDPSAHKVDERRRNMLIGLGGAVLLAVIVIALAYWKKPPAPQPPVTTATTPVPTQTQSIVAPMPTPTPSPTPTQTQAPTATTTATHTATAPTMKPTATSTATTTTTQTAPTNTNTFNPLIEHDF